STGQAENPLGKMHFVGLGAEEKCAVAIFEDRNLMTGEEAIHRLLIEQTLLLKLFDGEATRAASRRPRLATCSSATHWAYT
ncbi:MAG TPA: hypothetical protein VNT27_10960, partial [Propionibacteriaceae bacterium]|nr:hypothetical protein [Propionibacteriaceae bacterium]